jgi:recombination protein RecA
MAKIALAALESALRDHKLDRTLTTALPPLERVDPAAFVPTGLEALDAHLRSGMPRGHLSEIVGPRSSGRTTLAMQLMAAATREGELVALIDTFDRLDVTSLTAAGADLSRVLWVRGQAVSNSADLIERALDRALKAFNLVLQAGGFGIVILDLADAPRLGLQRIPFTTWLRVQRAVEGHDTACVLLAPEPVSRSSGGVTLVLAGRATWAGNSERSRRMAGADVDVRVVSPRRRVDGQLRVGAAVHEDRAAENITRKAC